VVVKKIMKLSGLPSDLSLHHLRHTYGSWMLRLTGDLKYVQDEMGHLDISTTKNYMHNIEDRTDPARGFSYE
jgi:site-specific recombinase XerD